MSLLTKLYIKLSLQSQLSPHNSQFGGHNSHLLVNISNKYPVLHLLHFLVF